MLSFNLFPQSNVWCTSSLFPSSFLFFFLNLISFSTLPITSIPTLLLYVLLLDGVVYLHQDSPAGFITRACTQFANRPALGIPCTALLDMITTDTTLDIINDIIADTTAAAVGTTATVDTDTVCPLVKVYYPVISMFIFYLLLRLFITTFWHSFSLHFHSLFIPPVLPPFIPLTLFSVIIRQQVSPYYRHLTPFFNNFWLLSVIIRQQVWPYYKSLNTLY